LNGVVQEAVGGNSGLGIQLLQSGRAQRLGGASSTEAVSETNPANWAGTLISAAFTKSWNGMRNERGAI